MHVAGQAVTAEFTVRDSTGALADGGAITAALTAPDGTQTSLATSSTARGRYSYTFTPDISGRWSVTAGASGSSGIPARVFNIFPPDPHMLISIEEAKSALNFPADDTANDEEIMLFIAAATNVIEDITGPLFPATYIERFDGNTFTVLLSRAPEEVISVTDTGTTVDPAEYTVEPFGRIRRLDSQRFRRGFQTLAVTYRAGTGIVPAAVVLAARELIQFSYRQSQQGERPQFGGGPDMATTRSGYLVPKRVLEWLDPAIRQSAAGIA